MVITFSLLNLVKISHSTKPDVTFNTVTANDTITAQS